MCFWAAYAWNKWGKCFVIQRIEWFLFRIFLYDQRWLFHLRGERKIFKMRKEIIHCYQQKAVKKNFSTVPGCGEKNSPLKLQILPAFSTLNRFNAKRCGNLRWKIFSPINLNDFFNQTSTNLNLRDSEKDGFFFTELTFNLYCKFTGQVLLFRLWYN